MSESENKDIVITIEDLMNEFKKINESINKLENKIEENNKKLDLILSKIENNFSFSQIPVGNSSKIFNQENNNQNNIISNKVLPLQQAGQILKEKIKQKIKQNPALSEPNWTGEVLGEYDPIKGDIKK